MKKSLLLLIAAFGLLLSGCEKNEESDELQVDRIAGTWSSTINIDGGESISLTITFTSAGTWTATSSGAGVPSGNGTYTITNTTLRLKEGSSTTKWKIKSLTETQAVFYWDEIDSDITFVRR